MALTDRMAALHLRAASLYLLAASLYLLAAQCAQRFAGPAAEAPVPPVSNVIPITAARRRKAAP